MYNIKKSIREKNKSSILFYAFYDPFKEGFNRNLVIALEITLTPNFKWLSLRNTKLDKRVIRSPTVHSNHRLINYMLNRGNK